MIHWDKIKMMKRVWILFLVMLQLTGCTYSGHTVIEGLADYNSNRSKFKERNILLVFVSHASSTRILEDLVLADSNVGRQLDNNQTDILIIPADDLDTSIKKLVKEIGLTSYPAYVLCDNNLEKCSEIEYQRSTNIDVVRKGLMEMIARGCKIQRKD